MFAYQKNWKLTGFIDDIERPAVVWAKQCIRLTVSSNLHIQLLQFQYLLIVEAILPKIIANFILTIYPNRQLEIDINEKIQLEQPGGGLIGYCNDKHG